MINAFSISNEKPFNIEPKIKNGYELEWTAAISAVGLKRMFFRLTIKTCISELKVFLPISYGKKIAKNIMKYAICLYLLTKVIINNDHAYFTS
jgi:hypothetical protein